MYPAEVPRHYDKNVVHFLEEDESLEMGVVRKKANQYLE